MHILPSWLSSPSWPHKHAACCIPLLKNFPRKRGPNGRSTPTCLHRLHCLHGSHDGRCRKRAGARRGVRDPRSGCSNRVNVAPQSRSRLPLTGPILDTQHVRQTTSCTPRIDLESDVALASCSHSLTTLECSTRPKPCALTLLFFCTRRGPSGSQEPAGPKDLATSLETCRHVGGPKLLTSSPSSPGLQVAHASTVSSPTMS